MSHVRTQIRETVITLLKAATTAAGTNVLDGMAPTIPSDVLPCIVVRTPGEIVSQDDGGETLDGTELRVVTMFVDVFHARPTDSQTALDALVVQVEKAIAAARRAGGLPRDLRLISSATLFNNEDGEQQFGCTRLEYRMTYRVDETDPETAL